MKEGGSGEEDIHYFLDFTMGVLGESNEDYKKYIDKIQLEYSHLSPEAYAQLRLKVRIFYIKYNLFCSLWKE